MREEILSISGGWPASLDPARHHYRPNVPAGASQGWLPSRAGLPIAYFGPAPGAVGVQQINLTIPSSFAGSGLISISLGVNPVYFVIQ